MNYRSVAHVISLLLGIMGLAMTVTSCVSLVMGDGWVAALKILGCAAGVLLVAFGIFWHTRRKAGEPSLNTGIREGFASVGLGWFVASFAGALPFMAVQGMTLADSVFETASGLTTTGASVIASGMKLSSGTELVGSVLESFPRGLLFWRAMMNWLGGVGIVFFVLLILPVMKVRQGKMLYNAEVPGLKMEGDQMTPRLSTSVKMVLGVYGGLTTAAIALYFVLGMDFFDAVCHAFSTISTGGFSTKSSSIAFYGSALLQWCVALFMFVSACNFSLMIKYAMTRKLRSFKDEEFLVFAGTALCSVVLITCLLLGKVQGGLHRIGSAEPYADTLEAYLRTAAFQVATVVSTTGFCTSDWMEWGHPGVLVILGILMFPCGCGGSTAGGIKMARIIVMLKQLRYEITHCLSPRTLHDVRLNKERIAPQLIGKTMAFIVCYVVVTFSIMLVLTLVESCSLGTAFGAALASISNVGPGFGAVGPSGSFAGFSDFSKYLLALTMITGRLELYTIMVMLFPSFWKR